jgi:hypothetical protein
VIRLGYVWLDGQILGDVGLGGGHSFRCCQYLNYIASIGKTDELERI